MENARYKYSYSIVNRDLVEEGLMRAITSYKFPRGNYG